MRKIPFAGIELTSQRVRGLRGTSELPGRPTIYYNSITIIQYEEQYQVYSVVPTCTLDYTLVLLYEEQYQVYSSIVPTCTNIILNITIVGQNGYHFCHGDVAQMVERSLSMRQVVGSMPIISIFYRLRSTCPLHTNGVCGKREAHIN